MWEVFRFVAAFLLGVGSLAVSIVRIDRPVACMTNVGRWFKGLVLTELNKQH